MNPFSQTITNNAIPVVQTQDMNGNAKTVLTTHVAKPKKIYETAHLLESGYLYGQKEVAIIFCEGKKINKELQSLLSKLDIAIKDRNLLDSKRREAKVGAFWNWKVMDGVRWRQSVNNLNTQKAHVTETASNIVKMMQKNQKHIKIVSLTDKNDENIDLNDKYLETSPALLMQILTEKRYKSV